MEDSCYIYVWEHEINIATKQSSNSEVFVLFQEVEI